MKMTFIGGGNMTTALISGLRKQHYSAAAMQVVEPIEERRTELTEKFGVRCCPEIDKAAMNCEILVIAVKPLQAKIALAPVMGPLRELLTTQLVVSVAAGLRLADVSRWLGGYHQLVRSMPNTPALIGAGITGLFADPAVDHEGRDTAEKILGGVGNTLWVADEAQMDAVTAVSGSGPAYVFYFIEALQQAALSLGFNASAARVLAIETFVGAARLAEQTPEQVSVLRQRVTSKGGTTEAALASFEASGLHDAILRGVMAAMERGRELGDEIGRD